MSLIATGEHVDTAIRMSVEYEDVPRLGLYDLGRELARWRCVAGLSHLMASRGFGAVMANWSVFEDRLGHPGHRRASNAWGETKFLLSRLGVAVSDEGDVVRVAKSSPLELVVAISSTVIATSAGALALVTVLERVFDLKIRVREASIRERVLKARADDEIALRRERIDWLASRVGEDWNDALRAVYVELSLQGLDPDAE